MDRIEQAIFTSAETDRGSGYQIAAASPGAGEADLRELAAWGPSHDSLLDPAAGAMSLNFHPLPSGAYCISRTTPSGWEYSGRGGLRVYTQCLIVPRGVLGRFANNPFAVLRAATAGGLVRQHEALPDVLEAFVLPGRAAAVDSSLLARLSANPGPEWMATLVQAALDSVSVAVAAGPPADQLIAGLINCLPPECRIEFSFSTGLKFSSRRPFRIVALSSHPEELRRVERLYNVTVLRLTENPPAEFAPIESWPRFIHRVLKTGRVSFLAGRLSRRDLKISSEELSLWGLQLLEELDASSMANDVYHSEPVAEGTKPAGAEEPARAEARRALPARPVEPPAVPTPTPPRREPQPSELAGPEADRRQAHAPHRKSDKSATAPAVSNHRPDSPSKHLDPGSPAVLARLERLDDLVFEAISGHGEALGELKNLWREVCGELDQRLVAQSREQYLRYALSVWSGLQDHDGTRNPIRAAQSLEVLSVLFDQV